MESLRLLTDGQLADLGVKQGPLVLIRAALLTMLGILNNAAVTCIINSLAPCNVIILNVDS